MRGAARLALDRRLGLSERAKWIRYNFEIGIALKDGLEKVPTAWAHGGDAMQSLHEDYCGTPPIPLKSAAAQIK